MKRVFIYIILILLLTFGYPISGKAADDIPISARKPSVSHYLYHEEVRRIRGPHSQDYDEVVRLFSLKQIGAAEQLLIRIGRQLISEGRIQEASWAFNQAGHVALAAAIEDSLASSFTESAVLKTEPAPENHKILIFSNGQEGIFKSDEDANHEIAAYRLSRQLGLDLVPVTIPYNYRGTPGALQYFVRSGAAGILGYLDNSFPHELQFFDYLIFNNDRIDRNTFVREGGYVVAIDNGSGFCPYGVRSMFYGTVDEPHFVPGTMQVRGAVLRRLRMLDRQKFETIFSDLLLTQPLNEFWNRIQVAKAELSSISEEERQKAYAVERTSRKISDRALMKAVRSKLAMSDACKTILKRTRESGLMRKPHKNSAPVPANLKAIPEGKIIDLRIP